MARGRNASTSETRVLLEILLGRDRAVFLAEIADELPVGKERVRQLLSSLVEDGKVDKNQISGRNLYRLTDKGFEELSAELRDRIQ